MLKLNDYIKIFPNVLDTQFCENIINNKKYKFTKASIISGSGDPKSRNCYITKIVGEDDDIIYQAVAKTLNKYFEILAQLEPSSASLGLRGDTGYDLLKYETGGFYIQHLDDSTDSTRRISMTLLLNEEYEGGEFQFFGDYKVTGKTGSAIVFPSNFCYPHEILPIKSGTRYSIITWMF
jgi:predicted 2-oxoglutarate/Fe(II)-dependent dioxygenase YbiX